MDIFNNPNLLAKIDSAFQTVQDSFGKMPMQYIRQETKFDRFSEQNSVDKDLEPIELMVIPDYRNTYFDEPTRVANMGLKSNVGFSCIVKTSELVDVGLYNPDTFIYNVSTERDYFIVDGRRFKVVYFEGEGHFSHVAEFTIIRGQEVEKQA